MNSNDNSTASTVSVTISGRGERKVQVLNPISITDDTTEDRDRWIALDHRGYFVTVDQGTSIARGPHIAKLYYYRGPDPIWLGTGQITCHFYSTKLIRKKLRRAIKQKAFFCTDDSGKEEFETTPPSEELCSFEEEEPRTKIKKKGSSGKCVYLKAPSLTCPLCKAARKTAGSLRRHCRMKHKRTLVYWRKLALPGLTKGR